MIAVAILSAVVVGGGLGIVVGYTAFRDRAREEAEDRMSRILDLPPARIGTPHNTGAAPARTSRAVVKNRRNWRVHE